MTGRRKPGAAPLPPNLYRNGPYFQYRHPQTGRRYGLGRDKAKAVAAARKLNDTLMGEQPEQPLVSKVLGILPVTVHSLIDRYLKERVPDKKWKPQTEANMKGYLRRYQREFGTRMVAAIDTKFVADWLDALGSDNAYIKHRPLLIDLFAFAKAKGLTSSNPAAETLRKLPPDRMRHRLDLDKFWAIHEAAPLYLQVAMELMLITLLRPIDAVRVKRTNVIDGWLRTSLIKTDSYDQPVHLEICMTSELEGVFAKAASSGIASPFVIHRRPDRKVRTAWREHWTQVDEGYLGRAFTEVRDTIGAYAELPPAQRPTLYEIRSLGVWVYEKLLGYPRSYTKALTGHTTEKMTGAYEAGHEISYQRVEAGLKLGDLR